MTRKAEAQQLGTTTLANLTPEERERYARDFPTAQPYEKLSRGELGDEWKHINWLPGDLCEIHLPPLHEGMDPRDADDDRSHLREIVSIERHRNNPTFLTGFTLRDPETGETESVSPGTLRAFVYPAGHRF